MSRVSARRHASSLVTAASSPRIRGAIARVRTRPKLFPPITTVSKVPASSSRTLAMSYSRASTPRSRPTSTPPGEVSVPTISWPRFGDKARVDLRRNPRQGCGPQLYPSPRARVGAPFIRPRKVEFRITEWADKPVVAFDHLETLLVRVVRAYRFTIGILSGVYNLSLCRCQYEPFHSSSSV